MGCPVLTLVFDRGMVSDSNLTDIESVPKKYIIYLDKDQISGIVGSTLLDFENLDFNNPGDKLLELGFTKFDHQYII